MSRWIKDGSLVFKGEIFECEEIGSVVSEDDDFVEEVDCLSNQRYDENVTLKESARTYEELICSVDCVVIGASIVYKSHSHTPYTERWIGRALPVYFTGQSARLELRVQCDTFPEVEKITFPAAAYIERGDKIRVYIFKGEKKILHESFAETMQRERYRQDAPSVYVARDFKCEEVADRIEKLNSLGEVLITYKME